MAPSPKDSARKSDSKSPPHPKVDPSNANGTESRTDAPAKNDPNISEPLAPPPRPVPATEPDYFSGNHGNPLNEINPFEHSFAAGGGTAITPGGTKLPSVAALTSPAPHFNSGITPGFWGGLRSGPLSPAMLSGPTKEDYFTDGHHLRGGFPTPNESGMRSGLTPGGGGSMFPEPSPGNQHAALFSQMASGGATPGTLDFHRTAMSAAAQQKRDQAQAQQQITSQPQDVMNGLDVKPPAQSRFDQHDANDAANGLYLLANAQHGPQPTNGYAIAPQVSVHAHSHQHPQTMQMGGQSSETSPHLANRNGGSISTNSGRGVSEVSGGFSDEETTSRPNTRGKGKRNAPQEAPSNGRRKANEAPAKAPASKKAKNNGGGGMSVEPQSEEELDMSKDEYNANGKKMTDEEKRKNFLERNRVAALKCRQRKKQWLANLQQKVEIYTAENDSLQLQMQQMREEVVNLKTLLLAHKDCPVTQQQGIGAMHNLANMMGEGGYNPGMNPYGMAMSQQQQQQQQQQFMAQGGMPRRPS